jgi:acyl-CoA thioesterase-1
MFVRILMATVLIAGCSTAAAPPGQPPVRVIAFGDSLVSGKGSTKGHDFVSVLSDLVGVKVTNAGRSGDTTASAVRRLDSAVLSQDADIAIVLLGGNDLLRFVPIDQRVANIAGIAERLRKAGVRVILVGLGSPPIDPFGGALQGIASRTGSTLVTGVLDGILGNSALMSDFIHPNDAGHRLMAERMAPTLRAEIMAITGGTYARP